MRLCVSDLVSKDILLHGCHGDSIQWEDSEHTHRCKVCYLTLSFLPIIQSSAKCSALMSDSFYKLMYIYY